PVTPPPHNDTHRDEPSQQPAPTTTRVHTRIHHGQRVRAKGTETSPRHRTPSKRPPPRTPRNRKNTAHTPTHHPTRRRHPTPLHQLHPPQHRTQSPPKTPHLNHRRKHTTRIPHLQTTTKNRETTQTHPPPHSTRRSRLPTTKQRKQPPLLPLPDQQTIQPRNNHRLRTHRQPPKPNRRTNILHTTTTENRNRTLHLRTSIPDPVTTSPAVTRTHITTPRSTHLPRIRHTKHQARTPLAPTHSTKHQPTHHRTNT
ncbi:MAG: hypothetical protein J07HQW1_03188, partial [Haloquadratum walsbyi J07HQW1]